MCGISGIYNLEGSKVNEETLHQMTDIISYRGPDGFGYWYNDDKSLGLGHRRLSIIDLSEAGHQPMTYMDLTITFNGEIYNYLEIKKELQAKGYQFNTESDTEVLLAAYHLKGKNCLKEIDGMFSFAIWDNNKKELFCARDRFGEKPFYYYYDGKQFVFGSEIKQLFSYGITRELNPTTLHSYCSAQTLINPYDLSETFYKKVFQIEHSHWLTITADKKLITDKYWDIDYKNINYNLSFDKAIEEFNHLLVESVKRRLRSDVTVGTSLSGGLDSTTIAGIICRSNEKVRLNTFTASFPGFEKDETEFISIFKNRYTNISDHYVTPNVEEFTDDLETLLFHQDEPIPDTSIYAQYRVMKLAKQNNVTVLLDGQGADEYLAGYYQYWPVKLREMFAKRDKNYLAEKMRSKELIGSAQNIDKNLAFLLRYPSLHKSLSYLKNNIVSKKPIAFQSPLQQDYFKPLVVKNNSELSWDKLNDVLYSSIFKNGIQNLLRFADRNSMASSREVRLPFLERKLVEFVFSLPSNFKMQDGWSKFILRSSQDKYLPPEICWKKKKIGFATPQSDWVKSPKLLLLDKDKKEQLNNLKLFKAGFVENLDTLTTINLHYLFHGKV